VFRWKHTTTAPDRNQSLSSKLKTLNLKTDFLFKLPEPENFIAGHAGQTVENSSLSESAHLHRAKAAALMRASPTV
jgi:hypothetical protein